jgi:hypothetical protein
MRMGTNVRNKIFLRYSVADKRALCHDYFDQKYVLFTAGNGLPVH